MDQQPVTVSRFTVGMPTAFGFQIHSGDRTVGTIEYPHRYDDKPAVKFTPSASAKVTNAGSGHYLRAIEYSLGILELVSEAMIAHADDLRIEAERRKQEREEREAKYAAARLEVMERCSTLYEDLKWHQGERMRLRRFGYRATVFGTIDRINEPSQWHGGTMFITTEKGKHMSVDLEAIMALEVRDPEEPNKRGAWTRLYEYQYDNSKF